MASIYVNKIKKVREPLPPPETPDVLNLNCLNFFPNNIQYYQDVKLDLSEISPYVLKDGAGHIFENIWQGSKIYPEVSAQKEIKAGKLIWEYQAEKHVDESGNILPAYLKWREKLWNNKYPVRYPNGYHGRSKCISALWFENGKWESLDYVAARKKIYCRWYLRLVRETDCFKKLKELYDSGISLQICEVDVRPGLISKETLQKELNNTKEAFGHGYVLAMGLLLSDEEIDSLLT